jgi:hypothetical protein
VRAFSDVLGANNPISKKLAGVEDYLDSLMSAQSRNNQEEIGRIFDEAESKGLKDKVVAGLEAFTIAPEETLAQAGGYMLPNIAAGVLGKAAQLGKLGITAVQVGTGAAQAAGTVKGEIYRGVTDYLREKGLPEDQIEPIATKAQAWGGKNMDQIILAAGLGGLAASTGAERIITRMLTKTGRVESRVAQRKLSQNSRRKPKSKSRRTWHCNGLVQKSRHSRARCRLAQWVLPQAWCWVVALAQ